MQQLLQVHCRSSSDKQECLWLEHCPKGSRLDPLGQCSQQETEQLQAMQQQATVQWHSPGHVGWSIVPVPLSILAPQLLPEVKLWLHSICEFSSAYATIISSAL